MAVIDTRLLDCDGEPEITENFNRILALIDGMSGAITCTVTFDSDGGSDVPSQSVAYGGQATEPDPPTKADNTFSGWYLGDVAYAFDSPVTAPITLVAHWTPVATG